MAELESETPHNDYDRRYRFRWVEGYKTGNIPIPRFWRRKDFPAEEELLGNVRKLVGRESILAECSGLNYSVYVTPSRLLVGRRFTLGENYLNVPHTNVSTLELVTRSIIPPLTLLLIGAVGVFLVWWFPGAAQMTMPTYPFDFALVTLSIVSAISMISVWWRKRVAVLRIGINGSQDPITVKLVSTSKAETVFRALKG